MLPEINKQFLDIFTVGDKKLCVYEDCLVLGKPTFVNFQLTFQSESYLKISEHHFLRYFDFFHKVLEITKTLSDSAKNKETLLISSIDSTDSIDNNCVTFCCQEKEESKEKEKSEFTYIITSKYLTKNTFTFDQEELYRFFIGFRNLCFKVYCYPVHLEEIIISTLKLKPIEYFDEFYKTDCLVGYYSDQVLGIYEYTLLKTILKRHQHLLSKIKFSFDFFLDEVIVESQPGVPNEPEKKDQETDLITPHKKPRKLM